MTEKIVIKMEGKNYAEALREMKQNTNISRTGAQIKNIKKTARGDILLELKGGKEEAIALKDIIEQVNPSTKVEMTNREKTLHIADIEPDMGEADVKKAVMRAVDGITEKDINIVFMKLNNFGNQNAMISVNRWVALELTRLGTVRVGWVPCRVREKINILRCFRCLGFGHRRGECKGEDRSKHCMTSC
nr:uncharacterized protein LOC111516646 [Leptinotarsa decemlineata]